MSRTKDERLIRDWRVWKGEIIMKHAWSHRRPKTPKEPASSREDRDYGGGDHFVDRVAGLLVPMHVSKCGWAASSVEKQNWVTAAL